VSLPEFVAAVERSNPELAAQRFDVSIAAANLRQARRFPDPALSFGVSTVKETELAKGLASTRDVGLSQTIVLGGKRSSTIAVGRGQLGASEAHLDDARRSLRATAANAYIDALLFEQAYDRKRQTAADLDRLVAANERRLAAGDVGEVDVLQSRVEALQFRNELRAAEADVQVSRLAMTLLLAPQRTDSLIAPAARLDVALDSLNVNQLVATAIARRSDVIAARRQRDAARSGIRLASANRIPDVDLAVSGLYSGASTNEIAPTPAFQSVAVSLSLPLTLSRLTNRGELDAAQYAEAQAEAMVTAVAWRAEIEVRQAFVQVQSASRQAAAYTSQVLRDAERVRDARVFSYQRGAATLLDVLTAQRALNDVYSASLEADAAYRRALVRLAEVVGDWSLLGR